MRGWIPVLLALAAVVLVVPAKVVLLWGNFLSLERAIPLNRYIELEELRACDGARRRRILQGAIDGVVDFLVQGTSYPYFVGLYFTKVKMGSLPREYNVQIDTGSDILWVTCNSYSNCPKSSGLGIQLNVFDTCSSSTATSSDMKFMPSFPLQTSPLHLTPAIHTPSSLPLIPSQDLVQRSGKPIGTSLSSSSLVCASRCCPCCTSRRSQ